MKIAELTKGKVVVVGRNKGSHGTVSTGIHAQVLAVESHGNRYGNGETKVVKLVLLDADGNPTDRIRTEHPGVLLSVEAADEQKAAREAKDAEHRRKRAIIDARETEIINAVEGKLGVCPTSVQCKLDESERPVLQYIWFGRNGDDGDAEALLSALGIS